MLEGIMALFIFGGMILLEAARDHRRRNPGRWIERTPKGNPFRRYEEK